MTFIARFCLLVFLIAFFTGFRSLLALQIPLLLQTQSRQQPDAVSLQQLLDRDDYIRYLQAMPHVASEKLTESQRAYFLGLLAFHVGKLDDAAQLIIKSININDKSLTANQVESALETLGQIHFKLGSFSASAQMYDDIDKAFGSKPGDGEPAIREKRHVAALLKNVPPQTINMSGDFTIQRTGLEYPVSVPQHGSPTKALFAQLDTGAEISVLSASTATAWGVTLLDGTATLHGYSGGTFRAQPGFVPILTIGTAESQHGSLCSTPALAALGLPTIIWLSTPMSSTAPHRRSLALPEQVALMRSPPTVRAPSRCSPVIQSCC